MKNDISLIINKFLDCGKQFNIKSRWDLEPQWPELLAPEIKLLDEIQSWLIHDKNVEIDVSGVRVHLTEDLPPIIIYLLLNNAYEHGDIHLVRKHVGEDDCATMIGAGIGIVATSLAQQTRKSVFAIDANVKLKANIERCAKVNNVTIQFILGVLADAEIGSEVEFTISKEFWSSSLNKNCHLAKETILVKAISLDAILNENRFNTLFIDVEGAEIFIFKQIIPSTVKKLFVEIHRPNIGPTAWAGVMNDIAQQGFQLKDAAGFTTYWIR